MRFFSNTWFITGFVIKLHAGATSGTGTAGCTSGAPVFAAVFSGVRVTRSIVLCVCFVERCLSFFPVSFGHCVVCSYSIYGFWLPPFGIFNLFLQMFVCSQSCLDISALTIIIMHDKINDLVIKKENIKYPSYHYIRT